MRTIALHLGYRFTEASRAFCTGNKFTPVPAWCVCAAPGDAVVARMHVTVTAAFAMHVIMDAVSMVRVVVIVVSI